jgi:hypothetical protein
MQNMMMAMNSDIPRSFGCACDPMAEDFTFEGKMQVMMEMMNNGNNSTSKPGSDSGSESGSDSETDTVMEKECITFECHQPIMQNQEVFNMDGTVRPKNNPSICAATKSTKKKAVVFWVDCEMGKNMSYYMNFTAEFHSTMSVEALEASFSFDGVANYEVPEHEEDRWQICTIKSNDHKDRCWTIQDMEKATSRSSPVYLKKCEPERLVGRQLWVIEGGAIMLVDDEMKLAKNDKWRSYAGIPYLGVGQKLKTRRIFDIELGGHQAMQHDGPMSPGSMSPGPGPTNSPSEPKPKPEKEWPACIFVGNAEMVRKAEDMFAMESHAAFKACAVRDFDEAANFFGQEPGTKYPDCLFLGVTGFADAAKSMFALSDMMHSEFNDCQVISYELLGLLG